MLSSLESALKTVPAKPLFPSEQCPRLHEVGPDTCSSNLPFFSWVDKLIPQSVIIYIH